MAESRAWRSSHLNTIIALLSVVLPAATAFLPSSTFVSSSQYTAKTSKLNTAPRYEHERACFRRPRASAMCLAMVMPPTGALTAAAADSSAVQATTNAVELLGGLTNHVSDGVGASTMLVADAADAVLSAAGMDPSVKLGLAAFAGVGVAAAGFKTAVYWRMQYVVAALLSNRVPAISGGAEVLELSAKDTKTLYYMPTGAVRRVILSTVKDLDQQIVDGAAIQAKVPSALIREQKRGVLSCSASTMDCVVSIYGFSGAAAAENDGGGANLKGLAQEVARVLKPGGTLLFVEKGEAKELVEVLREALGSVEVNMVQNLVDPYCVALATKTKLTEGESPAGTATGEEGTSEKGNNRRDRRQRKKAVQSRGR